MSKAENMREVRRHFLNAAQHKTGGRIHTSYEICAFPRGYGRTLGWGATVAEAWEHAVSRIASGEVRV